MTDLRRHAPAASRNREPILAVLRRVLPERGSVLEIAGGSGEHAVHFAAALPGLRWRATDADPDSVASIAAWRRSGGTPNLMVPRLLDVAGADWGDETYDAIFSANMIHISPWAACLGLLAGAGRHLATGGVLILYGPFRIDGQHTAASNEAFDADLRSRNPQWGVRDLGDVDREALRHGLVLEERTEMPANNQTVVWRKK
ncbi:MAG TPA: DUF938 domain-containing protein [Candidatus Binatia bacterium]